jgi:hypothetical protein
MVVDVTVTGQAVRPCSDQIAGFGVLLMALPPRIFGALTQGVPLTIFAVQDFFLARLTTGFSGGKSASPSTSKKALATTKTLFPSTLALVCCLPRDVAMTSDFRDADNFGRCSAILIVMTSFLILASIVFLLF